MGKYKVKKQFFKLSEGKNYFPNDEIELNDQDAKLLSEYIIVKNEKNIDLFVSKDDINRIIDRTTKNK